MAVPTPTQQNTCAVVVTYHPDAGLPAHIARIAGEVAEIVIVDNHSTAAAISMLQEVAVNPRVHLILNEENAGIATALNQGMRWAHDREYRWVVTFDQDTLVFSGMLAEMAKVFAAYPAFDRIAVIGANYQAEDTKAVLPLPDPIWQEATAVITSGMLLSVEAYSVVGPFRDDFFIDHVDDEYCLRARSMGLAVLMTRAPVMQHQIGEVKHYRVLGKNVYISEHSPVRWYYMVRNYLAVARQYRTTEREWVKSRAVTYAVHLVAVILAGPARWRKSMAMLRGGMHGLLGRMGPLH